MARERLNNLKKLYKYGKMSPALKSATKKLINAMEHHDRGKIDEYSWLHQEIGGFNHVPRYKYWEDNDYNLKKCGTTAYREFDRIWHGDRW